MLASIFIEKEDGAGTHTNHTKHGSEDVVDKDVGEAADGCRATPHQGSRCRARTNGIGDEGRRRAIEVPATAELGLHEALDLGFLGDPGGGEVALGP